jgi:hypothetical protein
MQDISNKTAGEKIETLARITHIGSKIVGGFAWETPMICFRLMDESSGLFTGRDVVWVGENATKAASQLKEGMDVALNAFCYGRNLRRVQVAKGCSVWGIGQ